MSALKKAREDRGVSQTAVADHLGITRQTYARYEAEPGQVSIEQARAICEFLHCPLQIFFTREVN